MRLPVFLMILTFALFFAGCPQFDTRAAADAAINGASGGFAAGGPLGAAIGAVLAAVSAGFAVKNKHRADRRDRIIRHYRATAGDIPHGTLAKLKEGIVVDVA